MGLATVALLVENQRVNNFRFDQSSSQIQIIDSSPDKPAASSIKIDIVGINADFSLFYKVVSRPKLVKDEGVGTALIRNMNITFDLRPHSSSGHLQFEL